MIRAAFRIVAGIILGWVAIEYVIGLVVVITDLSGTMDRRDLVALTGAQLLLVIAWGWLLFQLHATPGARARAPFGLGAVAIVPLLAWLGSTSGAAALFAGGVWLTGGVTALYLVGLLARAAPRAVIAGVLMIVVAVPLGLPGGIFSYFGIVVILTGLSGLPVRGGVGLRDLFPPAVGRTR